MEFRDKQAIYLQIAEYVCEQILLDKWLPGDKISSIRELAIFMEVTPNTIQRTYDYLQQEEVIANKRGVGYFVSEDGPEKVLKFRRDLFIKNDLPVMFRNMYLLKVSGEDVTKRFEEFIKENFKETK
ncbi:GntR family transcriptional regulator [uncultured Flavobacterium sp.]|uniref:GntR family transcriptional regulator n=1 Tax=uncultured Flavobacterium sp. TaxID=165435 RepID=UPI0029300F23|nr:GntR family transcriptional regulator [uncultured Flavobacterium sp.]